MSGSASPPNNTVNPVRCMEKPWDLWVAEIGHASPLRDDEPAPGRAEPGKARVPKRPERRRPCGVTRLERSCMSLYGQLPGADLLRAAVCQLCGATVKCCALHRHLVTQHSAAPAPLLPPPPPAPGLKLKAHKSKHKREPPPAEAPGPPPSDPPVEAPSAAYCPEPEVTPKAELKVSVDDNDLPVVSIRDNADLPLGDNLTDDIIAIMNSEGIQSIEELPEADPVAWKNLMQDFSAIQEMTIPENITTHDLYGTSGTGAQLAAGTYAHPSDENALQYVQPSTLPATTVTDSQPGTFPIQSAPVKPRPIKPSKSSSKPKYAIREYDPNKHCGVLSVDTQKPCTRSLTCKSHALSLRRQVDGRVKPFDSLLAEHRAAKLLPPSAAPVLSSQNTIATISIPSPPMLVPNNVDISDFTGLDAQHEVTNYYSSILSSVEGLPVSVADETELVSLLPQEVAECLAEVPPPTPAPPAPPEPRLPEPRPADVCWYPASPRPLAACTFSACHMGGTLLLGKRLATVRSNFKSTLVQPHSKNVANNYFNFSQNSLSSIAKNNHVNSAPKSTTPEVRKLIMSYPAAMGSVVKSEHSAYYNSNRQNGHLFPTKRPLMDDYEDSESKCVRGGQSVASVRSKVAKHLNQSDMMELNFMYDPLMADEKC